MSWARGRRLGQFADPFQIAAGTQVAGVENAHVDSELQKNKRDRV
jgi:hypothetical protein